MRVPSPPVGGNRPVFRHHYRPRYPILVNFGSTGLIVTYALDDEKGQGRITKQADEIARPGAGYGERDCEDDRAPPRDQPQFAVANPSALDSCRFGERACGQL